MMEIIIVGCIITFTVSAILIMVCCSFADSETFIAIDEKIAEKIRGKRKEDAGNRL